MDNEVNNIMCKILEHLINFISSLMITNLGLTKVETVLHFFSVPAIYTLPLIIL